MSPIPVLLCGKSPTLASSFAKSLLPNYEVVHICHSLAAGLREIPQVLRGVPVSSESDIGSNVESGKSTIPEAVIVGKGFSEEEVNELRNAEGVQNVPWLIPDDKKMTWTRIGKAAATGGVALPGIIAERVISCMREHGLVPGHHESVQPGLWGF